jgi:hypothetical protein
MLGIYRVAAQLEASQVVLSSKELVISRSYLNLALTAFAVLISKIFVPGGPQKYHNTPSVLLKEACIFQNLNTS